MENHPRFARVLRAVGAPAFVALLAVAGCRTPPDLTPFTDATSQLCDSIKASGRVTSDELDAMSMDWPQPQKDAAAKLNENFRARWTDRGRLADALLDYSASLVSVVEAGDKGADSVKAVEASFKQLTDTVGVALPPGTVKVAGTVTELGAYLYGIYTKDKAAGALGEGMKKMQPAIDETARVLGESLKQIQDGLDAIRDQVPQGVEDSPSIPGGSVLVRTERDTLSKLVVRRNELAGRLAQGGSDAALRQDLELLDSTIASQTARLAPFDAKKTADRERLSDEIRLVGAARDGLAVWAAAHARLADAALSKRTPNVAELEQTASDIRRMVNDIRDAGRK